MALFVRPLNPSVANKVKSALVLTLLVTMFTNTVHNVLSNLTLSVNVTVPLKQAITFGSHRIYPYMRDSTFVALPLTMLSTSSTLFGVVVKFL